MRRRGLFVAVVLAAALVLPAVASAHAYLVRTVPEASGKLNAPPPQVRLTFDEAVEPRFALISVTDADANQETDGPLHRAAGDPNTLVVPLKRVPEGWYLVFWRAISADGHPVRGFFTFEVGPNAGPPPQFRIPSISETAATPRLLTARFLAFLAVMTAIGLFALRIAIARPVVRRVEGVSLRPLSKAFGISAVVGLLVIPVYLLLATAEFALRSVFDIGALVPLLDSSAFGHGYIELEICFALFVAAASIAIYVDRPEREHRSIAELVALGGAALAAVAVLFIPGLSGHAAQTSPKALSVILDWLHVGSGSLWIGGLLGLLVLWRACPKERRVTALAVCVPRFSTVALCSVVVLVASGTWATVNHMPILRALWETSYGQVILVKIALLLGAVLAAAIHQRRTKPQLAAAAADPERAAAAAKLLRRLVSVEALLVVGAIFAAGILSSLPPPPPALAQEGKADLRVGPGRVTRTVEKNGYTMTFGVVPNKVAQQNAFALRLSRNGAPVSGADVTVSFLMLDMQMAQQNYRLKEAKPGLYAHSTPALVMVGHWGLAYTITPPGGEPFTVFIVDHATG